MPLGGVGAAELVRAARASLGTLLEAERYLVLRERGRPSRYHLVQSHVAAALGGGGSIDECRRLLRKLTQGPLPERSAQAGRLAGALRRARCAARRCCSKPRSADELDEAVADERRAAVRPCVASGRRWPKSPAADVLELAAALRDGGHLPRVDAALRLAAEPRRAYAGWSTSRCSSSCWWRCSRFSARGRVPGRARGLAEPARAPGTPVSARTPDATLRGSPATWRGSPRASAAAAAARPAARDQPERMAPVTRQL